MTALNKYQRLECPGLWRETPEAKRRDVIVSVGDASLVISDTRAETALSHWSLPALERLNPGERPAVYSPGPERIETLELDDDTMIEAIETVRGAIAARRARPGRLRQVLLGSGLAIVVGLGVFWMPGALVSHTASVLPMSKRSEIGRMVLADLTRLTGAPCAASGAQKPLAKFARNLIGRDGAIVVVREGVTAARHLPGRIVVLNHALIETNDTQDIAAGLVLAEIARTRLADPVEELLDYAGLRATFGLLTTGELPASAVTGYAEHLISAPEAAVSAETLLPMFETAGVPSSPYAYFVDPSGETVLSLIEADPYRGKTPEKPPLLDGEWVGLQGICG